METVKKGGILELFNEYLNQSKVVRMINGTHADYDFHRDDHSEYADHFVGGHDDYDRHTDEITGHEDS